MARAGVTQQAAHQGVALQQAQHQIPRHQARASTIGQQLAEHEEQRRIEVHSVIWTAVEARAACGVRLAIAWYKAS